MLHKRYNQLLHGFDFWGEPQLRDTQNLYELRTYHLKVFTAIVHNNRVLLSPEVSTVGRDRAMNFT